jgi:hypothetical protein
MPSRKKYPLAVPTPVWDSFIRAKAERQSHLSINDCIVEALIEYARAHGHPEASASLPREPIEAGAHP